MKCLYLFVFILVLCGVNGNNSILKFTVQMVGYSPEKTDDYVAVTREAIPGYIVGFEPMANADRVHHMLLYGCREPAGNQFWKGMGTCGAGGSHILYAWAKNAPNLELPKNVSFSVGHDLDGIKYFVLQIHYAQPFAGNVKDYSGITLHLSQKPTTHLAAVMLFVSGQPIPPGEVQHQNNISCYYQSPTEIHPFAFRTHTHAMGRVVSGFYKHDSKWIKIGSRNPQWPQLFESVHDSLTISQNDLMAASCRFDSHAKTEYTAMGSMGTDEMCNFYMMFYWDANKENPFPNGAVCGRHEAEEEFKSYPEEGFQLLPSHPELEHHAHQSSVPFGIVDSFALGSIDGIKLGQVSGLSFDRDGNLIVFHRADRVWNQNTFDNYNILLDENKTPISHNVILIVDIRDNNTKIVKALGKNKFYLPHGIHADEDGYIYTTDVGSHTVAKWEINGDDLQLIWEFGEKLLPGVDEGHFCKPAGIVKEGNVIYVADGYCNSRIVKLSTEGKRLGDFGLPGDGLVQFHLPHDIRVNSKKNLLVADRENGRVQEITTDGVYVEEWTSSLFSNIYSVDAFDEYVFMIPGRPSTKTINAVSFNIEAYVGRAGTGLIEFGFSGTSRAFGAPHVLRVDPTGQFIFIGDIAEGNPLLWKFEVKREGKFQSTMIRGRYSADSAAKSSVTPLLIVIGLLIIITAFVYRRKLNPSNGEFDRTGFKPVRTEENVAFISDGSDSE